MSKEDVIALMGEASSEEDWNRRCDQVKKTFGGYPDFWYTEVVASGLAARTIRRWEDGK